VEFVELDALSEQDWVEVVAGEHQPYGPEGAELIWRTKDHHFALRAQDERLVALAGLVAVAVEVEDSGRLDAVGLGSVIVTRSERGRGLMTQVVAPTLAIAERMGPAHAMLFCRAELVHVYRRFGFEEIAAAVSAEQPSGPVEMPMRAMWRALRPGAEWPAGRVHVLGLPF
jgi:predicted GNAT family N-acyltransferase